jgi:segregation and condensation protein A
MTIAPAGPAPTGPALVDAFAPDHVPAVADANGADGTAAAATAEAAATAGAAGFQPARGSGDSGRRPFHVRLSNFDGPFDLLLQLISQHRMDVTEVALHQVTDDFVAHIRAMGSEWDLDQVTEFIVVAATLLDLKAARLLPDESAVDELDDDAFGIRDLLFARLLAYRAYQQVAALFAELEAGALRRYPRAVTLEQRYLGLLPEVRLGLSPEEFAALAAGAFRPKPPPPTVNLDHIHASPVSVAEHQTAIRSMLADRGIATFGELVAGCAMTLEVVARFLALLNLYREALVAFDQPEALGLLTVRWTGPPPDVGRGADSDPVLIDPVLIDPVLIDPAMDEEYE